jgi:hypothetical protein
MKTTIDKVTGAVTFNPECELDRQLLFHLMDCADLTEFTMYLENYPNIANFHTTVDLGVPAEDLLGYPCPSLPYVQCTALPYEPVKPVSLYTGDKIGFRQFVDGRLTDSMIMDWEQENRTAQDRQTGDRG